MKKAKKVKPKVHPNHKCRYEIVLDDEKRGIKFKRVTDIINNFENNGWLVNWHKSECIKKMNDDLSGEGIRRCFNSAIVDGKIDENGSQIIIDKIKNTHEIALEEANRKSREAKEIGSAVHELIEQFVCYRNTGNDFPKIFYENKRPEVVTAFNNFLKWEKEYVSEWVCQEMVVWKDIPKTFVEDDKKKNGWTKGWGVAGRFDAIVILKDGRWCIVDFKTSKVSEDGYYESARLQLALYYWLFNYCKDSGYREFLVKTEKIKKKFYLPYGIIDFCMLVRLDKDEEGLFEMVEIDKGDLRRAVALVKKIVMVFFDTIMLKTSFGQKKAKKKSISKKAEAVA